MNNQSANNKSEYPIPYRISDWNTGDEILYRCPQCACDFRILSNQEYYCHNCGLKINWDNVPIYLTPEQLIEYNKIRYRNNQNYYSDCCIITDKIKDEIDFLVKIYSGFTNNHD